ncbi:MAG: hypothetical protein MI919_28630 [Holophagales bacterium]|nr:hypothetical protein [Holophagales bacterium]
MSATKDLRDGQLERDLRILNEQERREQAEPVTELEILDHLAGELDPEASEELLDRLSLDPEAASLALELADPSRLEASDSPEIPSWRSIRSSLQAKGLLDVGAAAPGASAGGVDPLWRLAAVVLLATTLGLGALALRQDSGTPDSEPRGRVAHLVLREDAERTIRSETAPEARISLNSDAWLVVILTAGDVGLAEDLEATLRGAGEGPLWSGPIDRTEGGTFDLIFPGSFLDPGEYSLEVSGVIDGNRESLATYSFEVEPGGS